ncbi:MAG: hypothetical protein J6W04_02070 [Bacteroidales bacterium]|nr:hypothetical protein [Bacteroidales bacterium]
MDIKEIVKSLRCCSTAMCRDCPRYVENSDDRYESLCQMALMDNAADLIEQMQDGLNAISTLKAMAREGR